MPINDKECYVCHKNRNIQKHHIFFGANRKHSDKYDLTVYLCVDHHLGNEGVHNNKPLNDKLKRIGQEKFEEDHSRDEFIQIFGKNFL